MLLDTVRGASVTFLRIVGCTLSVTSPCMHSLLLIAFRSSFPARAVVDSLVIREIGVIATMFTATAPIAACVFALWARFDYVAALQQVTVEKLLQLDAVQAVKFW